MNLKIFSLVLSFIFSFHELLAADKNFLNSYESFTPSSAKVLLTPEQRGIITSIQKRINDGEIIEMSVSTTPQHQICIEIRDVSCCFCFLGRERTTLIYDEPVATRFISHFLDEEDVILKGIDCLTDLELPYVTIPKFYAHG